MSIKMFNPISIYLLLFFFIISCDKQATNNPPISERILIDNDEGNFDGRVTCHSDKSIPVDSLGTGSNSLKKQNTLSFKMMLRAEIKPPKKNGILLHANHVTLDENYAYVSYHTPESEYRGAVEIIKIKNINNPRIISHAYYNDTDITIITRNDDKMYIGGAIDSDHNSKFKSPAVLEVMSLNGYELLTNSTTQYDLVSFNANDITHLNNYIYITSGSTNGALSIIHKDSLNSIKTIALENAKAVDYSDDYIIVMEGTGTSLSLFNRDKNHSFYKKFDLGSTNFFESKAEIDIIDNLVYLSAAEDGMKIFDISAERITNEIMFTNEGHCNAVSGNKNLAFMANGNKGVYVIQIKPQIKLLGVMKFDASTNFVAVHENILFVAVGASGFKIIEIVENK